MVMKKTMWVAISLLLATSFVLCIPNENTKVPSKEWTFIIYMAADNDLQDATIDNLKQMAAVGSNDRINIVVQVNRKDEAKNKVTYRYYVEKHNLVLMNADDEYSQAMDSGDPKTLISCCAWALGNYPARYYALILWNHGSGILDRSKRSFMHGLNLFSYDDRGICWDDTTGNYLSNKKLAYALNEICSTYLFKKFDIIGFDACLMGMFEVGAVVKNYAKIMVASQETEDFTGWNYEYIFAPPALYPHDPVAEATLMVNSYKKAYQASDEFTLSALDLYNLPVLEQGLDDLSMLLIQGINKQRSGSFIDALKRASDKGCTHFGEPTYIDLYHFLANMLVETPNCQFSKSVDETLKKALIAQLKKVCNIIDQVVIANGVGTAYRKAHGISIYFPQDAIDRSYKTYFAKTKWLAFLKAYLG